VELKREQALIRAAQKGDESALSEIYNAYVDNIYRYFLYRVDGTETAQDLTAEVFLRVVEGINDYQDREVPVLAWIYRIAHARLVDHYRQQRQNHEDLDDVELSTEDDLDGVLMKTYHQEQVRQALQSLTSDQQQVIILRFIEGYSLQKTAETLGKKIGAVKVMQHRALEALSRGLSKQGVKFEQNS
jgi:RNA polymerase sigma-70 factor (ECF subfamily)